MGGIQCPLDISSMMRALLILFLLASSALAVPTSQMDSFVDEVNRNIANQQWVAAKHFESFDDVIPMLGVKMSENHERRYREGSLEDRRYYEAPASFDLRKVWANCTSLQIVYDQAGCGCDWAMSATNALSDRICMLRLARPEDGQQLISAEDLMSCCWSCSGDDGKSGCDGGDPYRAWMWIERTGVTT